MKKIETLLETLNTKEEYQEFIFEMIEEEVTVFSGNDCIVFNKDNILINNSIVEFNDLSFNDLDKIIYKILNIN